MTHTSTTGARPLRLHERIAEVAHRHPGCPAVVAAGAPVSYGQLDARARSLAHTLLAAGVRAETPVGVLLPRGPGLVAAILGIWWAGGAHVPLDPAAPRDRLRRMAADSGVHTVLTTGPLRPLAESLGRTVVEVGAEGGDPEADAAAAAGRLPVPDDSRLAYVLYTSGTTGRPKGVLVEHGALAAMAQVHEENLYSTVPAWEGRVALNNPATTDSFFSEFAHLAFGRTLYVVDEDTRRDPERLAAFVEEHGIEALDATPTQVRALIVAGRLPVLQQLRVLVLGGEPVDAGLWHTLRELPGTAVYNLYGPTECTVDVVGTALSQSRTPVLGRPWPGSEVLLLDDELRPVADTAPGEICVAGGQLARGYLNPGPAEAARFAEVLLPGRADPTRVYRTGDRGRWTSGGLLEFLGRDDDQVKIRGYRVELSEIEAALRECAGVLDVGVALHRSEQADTLRAWVVTAPGTELEEIRGRLPDLLPEYMVPVLAGVPRIPTTAAGKADTRALLALPAGETSPAAAGADPALLAVWRDILGVPEIAAGDSFFALGGDSLKATRMTMRSRAETGRRIPIRLIFDHPSFGDYCSMVNRLG